MSIPLTIAPHKRNIKYIVVHCTAGNQKSKISDIEAYWKSLGWQNPGYHYIVKPDGEIVQLQSEALNSNGVANWNNVCVHISYIGGIDKSGKPLDNRTPHQKNALRVALKILKGRYPNAIIQGHKDFPGVAKACPSFDAKEEYKDI